MTGLSFANSSVGQRVIGNKINSGYTMPDGWADSGPTDPTWKMGGAEEKSDWAYVLLQPDTTLDLKPANCPTRTYVQMFKKTEDLVEVIQTLKPDQLKELMSLSEKTAKSHHERFQNFHKLPPKQACLIFGGEKMLAADFSDGDRKYCEAHIRMISGLYGLLRPYDDVKPVRDVPFEGSLTTKRGKTVADYWGDSITKMICKDLASNGSKKPLLAIVLSDEYLRGIQLADMPKNVRVVRIAFEGGSESDIRKVRGMFGRYSVIKRITTVAELHDFEHEDWVLEKFKSTSSRVVYTWVGEGSVQTKKGKKEKKDDKADKTDKAGKADKASKREKERREASSPATSRSRSRSQGAGKDAKKRNSTTRRRAGSSASPEAKPSKQASKSRADRSRSTSRRRRGAEEKKRGKAEGSPRRKKRGRSCSS